MRMSFEAAEREGKRAQPRFLAVDECGFPAHGERIAADQVRGVVGAASAAYVEVSERELLGALRRVRGGHRVVPEEVVRVTSFGLAHGELLHRGDDRGA